MNNPRLYLRLTDLRTQINNLVMLSPDSIATFHLRDCDKAELMDLSAMLNIPLIRPEDNTVIHAYTLKVQHSNNITILMHSPEQPMGKILISEHTKMIRFAEQLSAITGPEVADKDLREHLEVVLNNIHESTLWLKTALKHLEHKAL